MLIQLTSLALLLGTSAQQLTPRAIKLTHRPARDVLEKRGAGITVENKNLDGAYHFDIKVGTPEQTVQAVLDSASAVTELYGRPDSTNDPGFLSNTSSTFKPFVTKVGNGPTPQPGPGETVRATDKITVGNDTHDDIPFMYYSGYGNTARFGFGFPGENQTDASFWHKASEGWADQRIGVFLSRHREAPKDITGSEKVLNYADSEVMVGGVNQAKYTGEINMYSFQPGPEGGWAVPLQGITVNGKTVPISANHTGAAKFTPSNNTQSASNSSSNAEAVEALVATGSTAIYAPKEVAEAVYANIEGAGQVPDQSSPEGSNIWQFPCNRTFIDVRLTIGGHEYAIQSTDMILGTLSNNTGGMWSNAPTPNSGMCAGAIITSTGGWKLGSAFLKNVYTVFDYPAQAVGFAQLSANAQPQVEGTSSPTSSQSGAPFGMGISSIAAGAAAALMFIL